MSPQKSQQEETAQQREQRYMDLAVELVLAVMSSASTEKISPQNWWSRARSALGAGAVAATSFASLASIMAGKLEIEVYTARSAERLQVVENAVSDDFADFCALLDANAVYIVAMAQLASAERRAARQQAEAPQGQLDLAPEVTG